MNGQTKTVAFLHYSAPPVVGGVENVMLAHLRLFNEAGYSTSVVAGRGSRTALPFGTDLIQIPEVDSKHPIIVGLSQELEQGRVPATFEKIVDHLEHELAPILSSVDVLIVHNVFTKHFNLPLTAALCRLLEQGTIQRCVAWCHDITWASPTSRSKVFPGYPWDLLRTYRSDITYVTVSQERQRELSVVFECSPRKTQVIYNGVNAAELLALSSNGLQLIDHLGMWESDLNLIMPIRVTRAKNIELGLEVTAALTHKGILPKLVVTGPPDPHDPASMDYFESLLQRRKELDVVDEVRFVYGSDPVHTEPLTVDMNTVSELFRVSDALFMPSRREGFGMPVLEAGLLGLPVFAADTIPSATEIGRDNVILFSPEDQAEDVAQLIVRNMKENPVYRLRNQVRQELTWQGIFQQQIVPLLGAVRA
jgi:mannosylglucosylglycerate synthase